MSRTITLIHVAPDSSLHSKCGARFITSFKMWRQIHHFIPKTNFAQVCLDWQVRTYSGGVERVAAKLTECADGMQRGLGLGRFMWHRVVHLPVLF
jgi:hypothetical protein